MINVAEFTKKIKFKMCFAVATTKILSGFVFKRKLYLKICRRPSAVLLATIW